MLKLTSQKYFVVLTLMFVTYPALAKISDGSVDYSLSSQALSEMTTEVVATMGYVVGLVYAIGSLFAIYNAMLIYIKLQSGEGGVTKSLLMLLGALLFLCGATYVLPAFFGYDASSSHFSFFG